MSTTHHPNKRTTTHSTTPARCLRHHVWMAACHDCRQAHGAVAPRPDAAGRGD
ncbi:hypothetical protein [Blastococcus sp. TF02A-35]|uniref:hypothetical protein n=1 Tax=Blastococcus sp. TF02A-35 TaxID=2559612 RepID=UPI001430B264|nr:hypothetical protein [Blastococcus sp. TF02A_35]